MTRLKKIYVLWFFILILFPLVPLFLIFTGHFNMSDESIDILTVLLKIGCIILTIWYGLKLKIKPVWAWLLGLSTLLPFMAWVSFIVLLSRKINSETILVEENTNTEKSLTSE